MTAGRMDMFPEQLAPQLKALTAVGDSLATQWQTAQGTISAGEAGIGTDPLGQKFRDNYDVATGAVRGTADPVPGLFQKVATAGTQGVADYEASDNPAGFGSD